MGIVVRVARGKNVAWFGVNGCDMSITIRVAWKRLNQGCQDSLVVKICKFLFYRRSNKVIKMILKEMKNRQVAWTKKLLTQI